MGTTALLQTLKKINQKDLKPMGTTALLQALKKITQKD